VNRVVSQHDASAANRAYYERAENRLNYRPDGGLDAAEDALLDRFLPAGGIVLDLGCGNGRWHSRWRREASGSRVSTSPRR
jgi:SAM-dependent methyltransferase